MRPGLLVVAALVLGALAVLPAGIGGSPASAPIPRALAAPPTLGLLTPRDPVAIHGTPAAAGASARILIGTADSTAVPNDGISTNLTAFPDVTLPADSSFQTGAEEVIGTYEAVFGLFTNTAMAPTAFYTIFANTSDQTVRLYYWVGLPILAGAAYDFALQHANGTVWTLTVNGRVFGDNASAANFDFGAVSASWLGGVGFSELAIYSTTTSVPSSYLATTAFAVHRPSLGWYVPQNGSANYTGPLGASWGAEGRTELSELAPGEVQSGTSLAPLRNVSGLWSTGALPVLVALTFTAPSVLGLGVVGIDVNVTTTGGNPVGGVPVYLGDALGGTASPATVVSSQAGSSASLLTAPNVTATTADVVRATVTILGYTGSTSASVTVTQAVQILVDSGTGSVTLRPGGTTTLTFHTLDTGGHPYPLVALALTTEFPNGSAGSSGGAGVIVTPDAGITDPNGSLSAALVAPPQAGSYAVLVSVVSLGAWGHTTVPVNVRPPPPSFWEKYGPSRIVPAAILSAVAVVVVVVVLILRRRRGKRQPLPEMDLRRMRQETDSSRSPAGPRAPATRTPPESDTP